MVYSYHTPHSVGVQFFAIPAFRSVLEIQSYFQSRKRRYSCQIGSRHDQIRRTFGNTVFFSLPRRRLTMVLGIGIILIGRWKMASGHQSSSRGIRRNSDPGEKSQLHDSESIVSTQPSVKQMKISWKDTPTWSVVCVCVWAQGVCGRDASFDTVRFPPTHKIPKPPFVPKLKSIIEWSSEHINQQDEVHWY